MALNSNNVRVAVTGTLSVGPTSGSAPADADSPLTDMKDLGYFGDDGVEESPDRSTNKIKGFQNAAILREVVTEASISYKVTLVETKKETVELYYGSPLDTSDGSIVIDPSSTGGRKSYVLDIVDGDDFIRTYIPEGEITEVGSQKYVNGEPIGYEVTITAYPSTKILTAAGKPGSAKKWYSSLVVAAGG